MANFTSVYDIVSSALNRANELTDGTSQFQSIATQYANQIHLSVLAGGNEFEVELGEPWPWALSSTPGTFNLVLPYETGTVSLTQGSATGTFSSAPSFSVAGWFLKVVDRPEYFRIATHVAASTSFTLDTTYTDTTGTSLSYSVRKLEYDLPNSILRLVGPMRVYRAQDFEGDDEGKIYGIEKNAFSKDFPLHLLDRGVPTYFTEIQQATPGTKRIMVNKYVSDNITKVDFDYIPIPVDMFNLQLDETAFNASTDTITSSYHGIPNGTLVYLDCPVGSLPTGLLQKTAYYVVNSTTNTFQLSLTLGGSAVDITAVPAFGTGAYFVSNVPLIPREHRKLMDYAITSWICTNKNDSQGDQYAALTKLSLQALVNSRRREGEHISKDRGRLVPRLDLYKPKRSIQRYVP